MSASRMGVDEFLAYRKQNALLIRELVQRVQGLLCGHVDVDSEVEALEEVERSGAVQVFRGQEADLLRYYVNQARSGAEALAGAVLLELHDYEASEDVP